MSKIISMKELNRIKMCELRIFEAEDDDIPDNRIISASNRSIVKICEKNNFTSEEETELLKNIRWHDDHCAVELEKLGWTITKGKKK